MNDSVGVPPAWPVIELSLLDDVAVADPAGVSEPVRVPVAGDASEAARLAALGALDVLGVSRCRVRGTTSGGASWVMVIDSVSGELVELAEPVRVTQSWLARWKWPLVSVASVACIAVVGVALVATPGTAPVQTAQVSEVDTWIAEAGQLPVSAPPGFDTYADFVVPIADITESDVRPVYAEKAGLLVIVDGADLVGVDVLTGGEKWRTSVLDAGGFGGLSQLVVTHGGAGVRAVVDAERVVQVDAVSGTVEEEFAVEAESILGGSDLFAVLPGDRAAVLTQDGFVGRSVPATSTPVGVVGEGLVSVSFRTGEVWVTVDDGPVLPASVMPDVPGKGAKFSQFVGFFDGRLVLRWSSAGTDFLSCTEVSADGDLAGCGAVKVSQESGSGAASYAHGLLANSGVLVRVSPFEVVAEGLPHDATVAAGFAWSGSGEVRERVSADGGRVQVFEDAPVPDLVLPDGRAVVRAMRGGEAAVYVLVPEGDAPVFERTEKKS